MFLGPRPKFLADVKVRGGRFLGHQKRINLSFLNLKIITVSSKRIGWGLVAAVSAAFLLFGTTDAPVGGTFTLAASDSQKEAERQALETQLQELEKQIVQHENAITELKREGKTLKNEIAGLNAKIAKLNLQIKATVLSLKKLDEEIGETTVKISVTETDVNSNKKFLTQTLQTIYEKDKEGLVEILLKSDELSDFFNDLNDLLLVQESLRQTLEKVIALRTELVEQKEKLSNEREDVAALKSYQDEQKTAVSKVTGEKNNLLKITKGQEEKYQELLKETKKTAAQIRSRIFALLGGGELIFEEAYKLAKFAESVTGVRAAFILAVLDRESALGKNVGRCDYKTAMHPTRDVPIFLKIVEELGLKSSVDNGTLKVSCPNADGAFGGAIGPAQFLPSTWNIYKDRVAEITGSALPNPWRNSDAFIAAALYLKDAGAAGNERIAAARYYCGSRWNRYVCNNIYGKKVVEQAQKFEEDIAVLTE